MSIIHCSGAVAQETPDQLVSETVLLENIAYTAKNYGDNSPQHIEAIATLVNVYATQPTKNAELKTVLVDFIARLRAKYGENNRLLDEPLAMLAKQLIDEKEYAKAIPCLEELRKSLEWESYRQIPNGTEPPLLIPTEHDLAIALVRTARYEEAETVFRSLIDRIEQKNAAENLPILASALESWTESYWRREDYSLASETALRCLSITRQLPDISPKTMFDRLNNATLALMAAGRPKEAVQHAEELARLTGVSREMRGGALNSLALAYESAKKYPEALAAANESLGVLQQVHGSQSTATAKALNALAKIHFSLGQQKEALSLLQRELEIDLAVSGANSLGVAATLGDLSYVLDATGDFNGALSAAKRSLKILETHPDELKLAAMNLRLSVLYIGQFFKIDYSQLSGWASVGFSEMLEEAKHAAKRSVEIYSRRFPSGHKLVRGSLLALGTTQFFSGDSTEALLTLKKVIVGAEVFNDEDSLVSLTETMLCLTYGVLKQDELSILWGKEAVNTLQNQRIAQIKLDPSQPAGIDEYARSTFDMVATLLVRQGRIAEAQQILQMLKEHELKETFRGASDVASNLRAELTGLEISKFSRFYELRDQQVLLATERRALEAKGNRGLLTKPEESRLSTISKALQPTLVQAMQRFLVQLESDFARSPSTVFQNSTSLVKEAGNLRIAIDRLASSEPQAAAVGLQYFLGKNTLTIILTIPGGPPIAYQQEIDRVRLYGAIRSVSLQMQYPSADANLYQPALHELYEMLIEPVVQDLKRSGARTLMLSLDDQLRLLPFAALLNKAGRYLIQDYTLVLYNEAANQMLQSRGVSKWRVAAMGLSTPVADLPALIAVPEELDSILTIKGIEGNAYMNEQFTKKQLLSVLHRDMSKPYNVLHVASHFMLVPGHPENSALYLGDGSRISLTEFGTKAFSFSHLDLVTYSACQTGASGGRDAAGQEMESLSAKTQRQGAKAVMATLWKVSDQSTGKFMNRFYTQLAAGLNKAEALRAVQMEMLEGRGRLSSNRSWGKPYFWAPFVLMGNWR